MNMAINQAISKSNRRNVIIPPWTQSKVTRVNPGLNRASPKEKELEYRDIFNARMHGLISWCALNWDSMSLIPNARLRVLQLLVYPKLLAGLFCWLPMCWFPTRHPLSCFQSFLLLWHYLSLGMLKVVSQLYVQYAVHCKRHWSADSPQPQLLDWSN